MSTETSTPTTRPHRFRRLGIVFALVVVVLVAALGFAVWRLVMAEADGITTGYLQAAVSAYQMGRPIPDAIFETGHYRVQVVTTGSGPDAVITVYVRDRYVNRDLYHAQRAVR